MAKSGKKLSKSRNSTNFDTIKDRSKFLISNAKTAFNYLWLTFIKALILQYFYLEYNILIETDALGYAIDRILNQLTFGINLNRIVTKTNLGQ